MIKFFFLSPLLFFLPLYFSLATQQIFSVNKFIYILFFAALLGFLFIITIFIKKKKIQSYPPSSFFLFSGILFISTVLLSSFFSATPIESFFGSSTRHLGSLFLLVLFFIFILFRGFNFSQKEWKYGIFFPIFLSGIISCFWAISQNFEYYIIFGEILNTSALSLRSFAGMGQPNFLAQTLIIPFFLSIFYCFQFSKKNKKSQIFSGISIIFSIILFLFAMNATGSRAGILGILTGLCILLGYILFQKYNKKQFLLYSLFLSTSIIGVLWLIIFLWGNELSFFLGGRGQSIESRYYFWNESLPLLKSYWVLGLGGDLLQSHLSPLLSMEAFASENFSAIPDRTHTFILDFILHFGILPFSLFFIGFYYTIKKSLSNIYNQDILSLFLLAGICGTFSSWIFGFNILVDSFFFIIAVAYIWNIKNISSSQSLKKSHNSNNSTLYNSPIILYISLFCIFIFSLFLSITAYKILESEKLLFILTQEETRKNLTEKEKKAYSQKILSTPFLSENIIKAIPFMPKIEQNIAFQNGEKYHYQSISWYQTILYKSARERNIGQARKYFFYTKNILGNHFPQQWGLLQNIKSLNIFSPRDISKFTKNIQNIIPDKYIKNPDMDNPIIQKFWKHHSQIIEEIFSIEK